MAQYEKRYGPLPPNVKEKLNIDSETLKERIREKLSTTPDAFKHYKIDREVLKKYDIDPKMLKPPSKEFFICSVLMYVFWFLEKA